MKENNEKVGISATPFQSNITDNESAIYRFEENLAGKIHLPAFTDDIPPLLPPGVKFDLGKAVDRVMREVIALVPGERRVFVPRVRL